MKLNLDKFCKFLNNRIKKAKEVGPHKSRGEWQRGYDYGRVEAFEQVRAWVRNNVRPELGEQVFLIMEHESGLEEEDG